MCDGPAADEDGVGWWGVPEEVVPEGVVEGLGGGEGDDLEVGARVGNEGAAAFLEAEHFGGDFGGHFPQGDGGEGGVTAGEEAELAAEVEAGSGGTAVGGDGDACAALAEALEGEWGVGEEGVGGGAVDDAEAGAPAVDEGPVFGVEVVEVDEEAAAGVEFGAGGGAEGGVAAGGVGHIASELFEEVEEGAGAFAEHFHFLDGFGDVNGPGHVVGAGALAGEAQELGGGGVGGVRGEAEAAAPAVAAGEEHEGAADEVVGVEAVAEVGHFVEPPDADFWRGEAGEELGEALDGAEGGGAGGGGFVDAALDGGEEVVIGEGAFDASDAVEPCGEVGGGEEGVAEAGVVEVGVGVDEAGEDDAGAEVVACDGGTGGELAGGLVESIGFADGEDFAAVAEEAAGGEDAADAGDEGLGLEEFHGQAGCAGVGVAGGGWEGMIAVWVATGSADGGGERVEGCVRARARWAARRRAWRALRWEAVPVPAREKAVPWSGLVRMKGRPRVMLAQSSKARVLRGMRAWS